MDVTASCPSQVKSETKSLAQITFFFILPYMCVQWRRQVFALEGGGCMLQLIGAPPAHRHRSRCQACLSMLIGSRNNRYPCTLRTLFVWYFLTFGGGEALAPSPYIRHCVCSFYATLCWLLIAFCTILNNIPSEY